MLLLMKISILSFEKSTFWIFYLHTESIFLVEADNQVILHCYAIFVYYTLYYTEGEPWRSGKVVAL
jgi:hypothetical protein